MRVGAVMARPVETCREDETVAQAAARLRRGRFRHLPVVRAGVVVGVVSDRDLQRASAVGREAAPVAEVMAAPPVTVATETPLEVAAQLLDERKIGCLPVVDDAGRAVGIVTVTDLLHAFVGIMGVREPSTRLELRLADRPGALLEVARIVAERGVNIASVVTEPPDGTGRQTVVLRLRTINPGAVVRALEAGGIGVAGPEAEMMGDAR